MPGGPPPPDEGSGEQQPQQPVDLEKLKAEIREIVRSEREGEPNDAAPLKKLDETGKALKNQDRAQDIQLKGAYAVTLLVLMGLQILVAHVIFVVYAHNTGWANVEPRVIIAWLSATVVQVIAVTAIVVRYLFPRRDA